MKALTLWQPHASLVAWKEKKIETRSWSTPYRGPLAIHAAKRLERDQAFLLAREPFRAVLHRNGIFLPGEMVRGAVVAICWLSRCVEITPGLTAMLSEQELAFGDYTPGRYAWVLDNVHRLPEPVFCRGRQRLWDWPGQDVKEIAEALERSLPEDHFRDLLTPSPDMIK